jgi:hypothetical protein
VIIPDEVKSFATWDREAYHKRVKGVYSKKEEKHYYWEDKLICLGTAIEFFCRFGNNQDPKIQELKGQTYAQFVDRDQKLIKKIMKVIKSGEGEMIENLNYLPIILREILTDATKFNAQIEAKSPEVEGEEPIPVESICALAELILKKKIKKLTKKDIPENLAFDLLLVMPEKDALRFGKYTRAKYLFDVLYMYAENNVLIDVPAIFKALVDTNDYPVVIGYALQERKEKTKGFNDNQMKFFVDVNEWIFDIMEDMDDSEIRNIIQNYIRIRKKDSAAGKDGNRRYFLSSLPEDDYPNVSRIIKNIKAQQPDCEKFL